MNPLIAAALFTSTAFYDAVWAAWTMSVTEKRAGRAAVCSAVIYLLGAIAVVSYTSDRWYLLPIALGGATGTYLSVRRKP